MLRIILALMGALLFFSTVAIAQARIPNPGWVAFVRQEGDAYHLYRFRPNGTELTDLSATSVLAPMWSPDGEWLVFRCWDGGSSDICRINRDSEDFAFLTRTQDIDSHPAWSPDGQWISFIRGGTSGADVFRMRPDGTDKQRLTNGQASLFYPAVWSRDSQHVAFGQWNGGICIMEADGANQTCNDRVLSLRSGLSWSPDGRWIVYAQADDRQLYRLRSDGGDAVQITDNDYDNTFPVWSPDGDWIVYFANVDGNWDIHRIRPDGTDEQRLTLHPSADIHPRVSPDGRWIIFESARDGNTELYRMRINGSELERITHNQATDTGVAWYPIPDLRWSSTLGLVIGTVLVVLSVLVRKTL